MKTKCTLVFFSLAICSSVQAQFEKGQGLLTGSVSGSFDRTNEPGVTVNQFRPTAFVSYGTFIKKHVLLGGEVSVGADQTKSRVDNAVNLASQSQYASLTIESYTNSISVTPFARYYWQYDNLLFYAGGGLTLLGSQQGFSSDNDPAKSNTNAFSAALQGQAGIIYSVSGRIGVELYAHSSVLPIVINTAGLGLVLFTGARNQPFLTLGPDPSTQLNQGGIVLSGNFSTTRTHQTTTNGPGSSMANADKTTTGTTASVGVGYFVHDRTQIGVTGSYTFGNTGAIPADHFGGYTIVGGKSPTYFSVEPYVKRYLSGSTLTPYVGGRLSWQTIQAGGPSTNAYGGYVSAGLAYLPGRRFIVEAELLRIGSSYSQGYSISTDVGSAYIPAKWTGSLDATLRPNFTLSYVFR